MQCYLHESLSSLNQWLIEMWDSAVPIYLSGSLVTMTLMSVLIFALVIILVDERRVWKGGLGSMS